MTGTHASATTHPELTGDYDLDLAHSRLGFIARHAMITKVRGQFRQFEGWLHLDGGNPTRSRCEVRIDAKSIDTGNAQRDEHLRSNDFFAMDTYPQITFKSTAVEPRGGDHYQVTGDLTVKGITRPVPLDVEFNGAAVDPFANTRVGFSATGTISRKAWGITWNAPLEAGGVLVSDKITIDVDLSAIKRA
jgi:polyisoprenoid-binding protein YceI